jgi:beta-lactamase regulating signal transducer with metallopeptidase domain
MPLPIAEALSGLLPPLVRVAVWLVNWLATYAVHSTILIGFTWLACRTSLGSRFSAAQRASLWRVALVGGVVTSTLQSVGAFAPLTGTMRVASELSSQVIFGVFVTAESSPFEPAAIATRVQVRPLWPVVVILVWLTGITAGWILLANARRRFFRRLDVPTGKELTIAGNALRELQRRAGSTRPLWLRATRHLHSPVAIGSDEIYLPERALAEFDLQHLESMLAHELAHLERRDATWLAVARFVEVVFLFQPLNRVARRHMVDSAELAADAWAVGITARPLTLAKCLARVAEWTSAERLSLAPAMVERRSSSLVQRVRMLTTDTRATDGLPGFWLRAAMLGAIAIAAFLAPSAAVGDPGSLPSLGARRMDLRVRRSELGHGGLGGFPQEPQTFLIRVAPPR